MRLFLTPPKTLLIGLLLVIFPYALASEGLPIISPLKINDHFYIINGTGTNIGVSIGEKSILVVDTTYNADNKPWNQEIIKSIRVVISPLPIQYVVNTHSHDDHTLGNHEFSEIGATIINHSNAQYSPFIDHDLDIQNQLLFDKALSINLGNELVHIEHIISHTFDDALVYFENSNVVFLGDSFIAKFWHTLGVFGLESVDTWVEKALSLGDEDTLFIPSHGQSFINKQQIRQHHKNILAWVERLRVLHKKGLSPEQIAEDKRAFTLMEKLILDTQDLVKEHIPWSIWQVERTALMKPLTLSLEQQQKIVGTYQSKNREDIEIFIHEGKLIAKQKHGFITWLRPTKRDTFDMATLYDAGTIKFKSNKKGKITELKVGIPKENFQYDKLNLNNTIWTRRL